MSDASTSASARSAPGARASTLRSIAGVAVYGRGIWSAAGSNGRPRCSTCSNSSSAPATGRSPACKPSCTRTMKAWRRSREPPLSVAASASTSSFACGRPTGDGCGCENGWKSSRTRKPAPRASSASPSTSPSAGARRSCQRPPSSGFATRSRRFQRPSSCGIRAIGWCCATRNIKACAILAARRRGPARATTGPRRLAARRSSPATPQTRWATAPLPAIRALTRRVSRTGSGCRSTSAAPAMAAMSRSAPTSPR